MPSRRKAHGRWFRGWRRWLTVVVIIVVAGAALESVPGVPGHDVSALSAQLLASNAGTVASKINPFASTPDNPCDMIESSYGVGNNLLKDNRFGFYASIWPAFHALDAFFLTSLLPGNAQCTRDFSQTLATIDGTYWAPGVAGLPSSYDQGPAALHISGDLPRVDDSLWMGITVIETYARTKDPALLARAEAVFALAGANWDPVHGGIYWEDHAPGATNPEKAVVSNAPAAVLAVDIYLATGNRTYLTWAKRIMAWLQAHLFDRADGIYNDHVEDNRTPPTVTSAKLTYNQGIVVGALALLSTVSPKTYPIRDAVALAQRAMAYFTRHHTYGQPSFDVVWAKNVLWLAALYHQPSFTVAARASLQAAVKVEPRNPGSLLDFSSEIALHELTKLPPRRYPTLAP
jgi:hypothetical protein